MLILTFILTALVGSLALVGRGCAGTRRAVANTGSTSVIFTAGQSRFVAAGPLTIDSATIVDGAAKVFFYLQPGATSDADCKGVSEAKVVVVPKDDDMAFKIPRGQGACVTSIHNSPTDDTPATVAWQVQQD